MPRRDTLPIHGPGEPRGSRGRPEGLGFPGLSPRRHDPTVMPPRPKKCWLVYVLRCGDGSLYTGITNDLPKRLVAHAAGKASKYTRSRLPVRLAHTEPVRSKSAALKREAAIKKLSRRRKDLLVRSTANRITGRQGTRTPNPLGVNEVL